MRLEKASGQAIRYACIKFHYAKSVPQIRLGYSVFNDAGEWCGVILYSNGANSNIASEYGLMQGEVVELVRVALNGKQEATSKALAMSLQLLKKDAPLVQVVVSFADRNQNHIGTIYQATNWLYVDERANERGVMLFGKLTHRRSINKKYGTSTLTWLRENVDKNAKVIKGKSKIKYVFPMNKYQRRKLLKSSKPYPKKNSVKFDGDNQNLTLNNNSHGIGQLQNSTSNERHHN